MQLTGKEIIANNIISNYVEAGVQQQGIDVRIKNVSLVGPEIGFVPAEGKTLIPEYIQLSPVLDNTMNCEVFWLDPGYYEIELMEGCEIPSNATLHFKTRSSLVRCGAMVHSGQFDAGFKTNNMGCFLLTTRPIKIEVGARIAQALVFTSSDVENLYDGQWQNDKQRNGKMTNNAMAK